MIKNDDIVCVAVSGGTDLLALIHILDQMSKNNNFRLTVITICEGLPEYQKEVEGIVVARDSID